MTKCIRNVLQWTTECQTRSEFQNDQWERNRKKSFWKNCWFCLIGVETTIVTKLNETWIHDLVYQGGYKPRQNVNTVFENAWGWNTQICCIRNLDNIRHFENLFLLHRLSISKVGHGWGTEVYMAVWLNAPMKSSTLSRKEGNLSLCWISKRFFSRKLSTSCLLKSFSEKVAWASSILYLMKQERCLTTAEFPVLYASLFRLFSRLV